MLHVVAVFITITIIICIAGDWNLGVSKIEFISSLKFLSDFFVNIP